MVRGMSSGSSSVRAAAGIVIVTSKPVGRRSDAFGERASMRTRPSSISRWARVRERPDTRLARNASSLSPARSVVSLRVFMEGPLGTRPEEDIAAEDDDDGDGDRGVGDVEGRPGADLDEVRHAAEPDAVDQVAAGAAEHHADGDGDDGVLEGRVAVVEVDGGEADEAGNDEEDGLVLQDAEGGAGVGDITDLHRPIGPGPAFASR